MRGLVGRRVSLLLFILYCGSLMGVYVEGEETSTQSTEAGLITDSVDPSDQEIEYGRESRWLRFIPTKWTRVPCTCTREEYCGIQFHELGTQIIRSDVMTICHCPEGQECAFYKDFMKEGHYGYMCRNITDSSSEDSSTHANTDETRETSEADATVDDAETANSGEENNFIPSDRIEILFHAEL